MIATAPGGAKILLVTKLSGVSTVMPGAEIEESHADREIQAVDQTRS